MFPKFDQFNLLLVARFADLKLLYDIELGKPLRKAYKLSDKILSPTNIEKTNVMLVDGLFHESTINAIRPYGKKEGYESFLQTAELLWIFRQWFNVRNVKSRYDGQRTRNSGREAVNLENRNGYLNSFTMWLQEWESLDTQGLSKQTFSAAKQTTNMLQGLINYLLDEKKFSYVLLRPIQSDAIESRIGWYRQLSEGNYFNSVFQFIQAEKTIRIRSLVQMGFNFSEVKEIFDSSVTERQNEIELEVDQMIDATSDVRFEDDLNLASEDNSIITYVAGSISRSLLKKMPKSHSLDCCISIITRGTSITLAADEESDSSLQDEEFLSLVSRGGLQRPSDCLFITCVHAYQFYERVNGDQNLDAILMGSSNPRGVFASTFV